MAKKEKKVTIGEFKNVMKENFENIITIDWHGVEVQVKKTISLVEMMGFVNEVVESCFDDEGDYMPEIMDFAIKSNVLTRYANFTMPDNLEARYTMIYVSDAIHAVYSLIDADQINEILSAIDRKINFLCSGDIAYARNQLKSIIVKFDEMQDQFGEIFDGLSAEDLSNMFRATSNNSIDEVALVKAFMEQKTADDKVVDINGG